MVLYRWTNNVLLSTFLLASCFSLTLKWSRFATRSRYQLRGKCTRVVISHDRSFRSLSRPLSNSFLKLFRLQRKYDAVERLKSWNIRNLKLTGSPFSFCLLTIIDKLKLKLERRLFISRFILHIWLLKKVTFSRYKKLDRALIYDWHD